MNRCIAAIDPGNTASALVIYRPDKYFVDEHCYDDNTNILYKLSDLKCEPTEFAIEMIVMYDRGAKTITDTAVWIGRFWEHIRREHPKVPVRFITRATITAHVCRGQKGDAAVRRALIDRFGGGNPAIAIGTKKLPGPMYKMNNDTRAALAVAVAAAELPTSKDYDFLLSEKILAETKKRRMAADISEDMRNGRKQ